MGKLYEIQVVCFLKPFLLSNPECVVKNLGEISLFPKKKSTSYTYSAISRRVINFRVRFAFSYGSSKLMNDAVRESSPWVELETRIIQKSFQDRTTWTKLIYVCSWPINSVYLYLLLYVLVCMYMVLYE